MIQTVFRLLILLCILTAILTVGSILTGKTESSQPDTEYWSRFGFDACAMPCFAGITPGETPFADTLELIAHYMPALSEQILINGSQTIFFGEDANTNTTLTGIARYAQGKVGEISLTLTRPLVSVLLRFGAPDCTLAYPQGNAEYLFLYWEDSSLIHWASVAITDSVHFYSPVFTITSSALENGDVCSANTYAAPWRGFAPLWVYANA